MYKFSLCLFLLVSLCGCGQGFIRGDAKLYEIDIQKIPAFLQKRGYQLVNAFDAPRVVVISSGENAFSVDLKQLTDTSLEMLKTALEKRDLTIGAQGKEVTLFVNNIQSHAGYWVRHTTLRLNAKLDNGKTIAITADYRSPGDAFRAINATLRKAVVNLLNHEDFIDYINGA